MNDDFYSNAYFMFVSKRSADAFQRFRQDMSLALSPAHDVFDVVNYETGDIVHSEETFAGIVHYLDANPESNFDFYLEDPEKRSFMFSYRPGSYHVMSMPYDFLDMARLPSLLVSFSAIFGWGWPDDAPPETFEEMKAAAGDARSMFLRYWNGQLLAPK
ncbi:hypothetical protein [Thioclava sp. GXIMD4216]|uniref:hypothetical protein n=1 Tax=unclassified Thioclava TaxID=2621713 RepID=UPI0030CDD96F